MKAGDYTDTYYYNGQYHNNKYNPKDNEASVAVFFDIKYLGKKQIGFYFNWEFDYNNVIKIREDVSVPANVMKNTETPLTLNILGSDNKTIICSYKIR